MCETEPTKPKRCGKYSFKLMGKAKTYFKETTIVDFAPVSKTKKIQKRAILPTYNNDRKFFTPAFIIPSLPLQSDQMLKQEHSRRVLQNTTQISQILVPKPRSRQKYCGVCREYYEEYLMHVMMDKHREKLRNSKFQGFIIEATQLFREQNVWNQPEFQKVSSVQTSCQSHWCSNQEQEEVDLVQACLNLA